MYAFLCPQTAKKFIYEHAIVMQSFFRQNWLVIIFMMLVKQLLSNQSTRIKQNSAMSRQIKFYIVLETNQSKRFWVVDPLFMAAGGYHFHEPITQPEIQTLRNLVNRFSLSRFWIRMFDIFFDLLSSIIHKIYWHQFESNQSFSWQEIMIYYL